MIRYLIIWWTWTAEPFLFNPIATIKGWLRKDEALSPDDLAALTPEERKALNL